MSRGERAGWAAAGVRFSDWVRFVIFSYAIERLGDTVGEVDGFHGSGV
jgi:hypothetical protein